MIESDSWASTDETDSRTGEREMNVLRSNLDDVLESARAMLVRAGGLLLMVAVATSACRDPLDVPDPNSIQSGDLESPAAVPSLVNGALKNMNQMVGSVSTVYATASDEIRWIGSRDAWGSISQGFVDSPENEFIDAVFPEVTDARYMADRAIAQAEEMQGDLSDQSVLVRAYLYGAVVYTTIADVYDDFVIPESPTEPAPPIGSSNMVQLYDQAITWLNSAESLGRDLGDTEMVTRAIAYRARVRHAKAVWNKLNPPGSTPDDPLVSNQEMADDASTALQRIGAGTDWRWQATFGPNTTGSVIGGCCVMFAGEVNSRGELQFGPEYVEVVEGEETVVDSVVLTDPVSGNPDLAFTNRMNEFFEGGLYSAQDLTTAREMNLLLAEHNLANNQTGPFETYINNVRDLAGKPDDYTGQVPAMEMLRHSRQANLVIMNRRLADMYRFGATSERWLPQSPSATSPGTFFPITITEIRSNPNVDG